MSAEKRPASVTPDPATKLFGGVDPTLTGTLAGFLASDVVTATYSRTAGETVAGSPYTISAALSATGDLANYAITSNTASFTITAAAQQTLIAQVPQPTAVYGSSFTATFSGGSGSGGVTFAASGACTNSAGGFSITMVAGTGTCAVTAIKATDGSYAEATSVPVFVTAQPLAASVTPNAASKVFGGVDPGLSGTLAGFLPSDSVTATYTRTFGETEGPYTISATLAPAGVLANYAITYNTATFTINPPAPSVQVLSPNGGEKVFVGVPTTISWAATGATGTLDVEVSRNSGSVVHTDRRLRQSARGITSCGWTPTTPASTTALIRVTAHPSGPAVSDVSDAVFTMSNAAPSITVTAPNTAVSWTVGSTQSITWNHNLGVWRPCGSSCRATMARVGKPYPTSTQNSAATTGNFPWIVTGSPTATALVRVTWLGGSTSDVSNVAFAIAAPTVTVTSPNTLVTWRSGTAHNITFNHNLGVGQAFDISVSRDSGSSWAPVATYTTTAATTGTYSWTVDGPATARARVRVASVGGAGVTDDSDTDFSVSSRIVVTAPNTAAELDRRNGPHHHVDAQPAGNRHRRHRLQLGQRSVVAAGRVGVPNSSATNGSYTGALPATQTAQGLIRVRWSGHPAEFDVSDVVFALVAPTVAVTAPNTAVSWVLGSHHNITWTAQSGHGRVGAPRGEPDSGAPRGPISRRASSTAAPRPGHSIGWSMGRSRPARAFA